MKNDFRKLLSVICLCASLSTVLAGSLDGTNTGYMKDNYADTLTIFNPLHLKVRRGLEPTSGASTFPDGLENTNLCDLQ